MDRYRQLIDLAPDAIVVVEPDSNIEYANHEAERIFGYSLDELVGKPHEILIPPRLRAYHAAQTARFLAEPDPKRRPMGHGLDLFGLHKDGHEIPIEVSLGVIRTDEGMVVLTTIRDISDRRRLETSAKISRERLEAALEAISDPIALFDASDLFVAANAAYWAISGLDTSTLGHSRTELAGAVLSRIVFQDEAHRAEFLADAMSPEAFRTRELKMIDGRTYRAVVRATADGGKVLQLTDLTEDIARAEQLERAQRAAEAASAAKSSFLSSMTHELRTPFNAIVGFAQLLYRDRREPLSERQRQRVDQILKGAEHLLHLIDDVLDLSHIEAGGISMSNESVEIEDVLDSVLGALAPAAEAAGVSLSRGALPPNALIAADRTRFTQILMNYGANAIKYNRHGGSARFLVEPQDAGTLRVIVADTGIGIPEDRQEKLFQPFQRAGQETGPIEGTGIGLAISKRLAELMNGTVGFRSAPGDGSEFWVDMPLCKSPLERIPPRSLRAMADNRFAGAGRSTVLYIEDNPANVALMRDLLSAHDEVELASTPTAEMGLELARMKQPKLIILDINLPGMNGIDAIRHLKAMPETRDIPVIALTAAATHRDRELGKAVGFYRYLTKPVKIDELEAAIEAVLGAPG